MKKLKVGIIGAGGIAQHHISGYLKAEGVELAALCDVDQARVRTAAREFGVAKVFTDYRDLLALKEIEAVSICTPNAFHRDQTIAALEAGKHVLVEKPIGMNAAQGREMLEAARRTGRLLMVAMCQRFTAEAEALKRAIQQGSLGEVYFAEAILTRRRGIPGWGVFADKKLSGGGPLIDLGVHCLDLALHLMGFPRPVAVSGCTYAKFGPRPGLVGEMGRWDAARFNVEDFAVGLVRFENGASLLLKASWASNIAKGEFNVNLLGTEGGCSFSPVALYREQWGSLVDIALTGLPQVNRYQAEVRAFVDAIRSGGPSPSPAEEAVTVTSIIDALYQSAARGKEVRMSVATADPQEAARC